jgi:hypothetical protein
MVADGLGWQTFGWWSGRTTPETNKYRKAYYWMLPRDMGKRILNDE